MNQPEALRIAMTINQSTLELIAKQLQKNPFDGRALKTKQEVKKLLENDIREAEQVHHDAELVKYGRGIYNTYFDSSKST